MRFLSLSLFLSFALIRWFASIFISKQKFNFFVCFSLRFDFVFIICFIFSSIFCFVFNTDFPLWGSKKWRFETAATVTREKKRIRNRESQRVTQNDESELIWLNTDSNKKRRNDKNKIPIIIISKQHVDMILGLYTYIVYRTLYCELHLLRAFTP